MPGRRIKRHSGHEASRSASPGVRPNLFRSTGRVHAFQSPHSQISVNLSSLRGFVLKNSTMTLRCPAYSVLIRSSSSFHDFATSNTSASLQFKRTFMSSRVALVNLSPRRGTPNAIFLMASSLYGSSTVWSSFTQFGSPFICWCACGPHSTAKCGNTSISIIGESYDSLPQI